uniref:RNA-directed RNA polymerase L n=1 Tax=Wuhan Louse Fly Virus 11 TaxID=1608115 RepID=A0A0B5KXS2_9VIRU|nr:RNA-dependent RNA polymerase [Wuhan Louse Fly Virus 11]
MEEYGEFLDVEAPIPCNQEEAIFFRTVPINERMLFLNTTDYNLNSPLIKDGIDQFRQAVFGREVKRMWYKNKWGPLVERLQHVRGDILDTSLMHRWFARWMNDERINSSEGRAFLKNVDQEAMETFIIPETFYKGWVQKLLVFKKKSETVLTLCSHYAQKFLDLHRITLLSNAVSELEQINLCRLTKCTRYLDRHQDPYFLGHFLSLGKVEISTHWVYLRTQGVLLDKNFLLMLKDVAVARLQTLLSMDNRIDKLFSEKDLRDVVSIYKAGDEILIQQGNDGYDSIKLVEPMCNLRMATLARAYRPLIPDMPSFREHIDRTVEEKGERCPPLRRMRALIDSEENIHKVLIYYGSFRHWGHPFINYIAGLKKLHDQVTMEKEIDDDYAQALASDLARVVLTDHFNKKKVWSVHEELVPPNHPFLSHIQENTWPTPAQIEDFGDKWHLLPLKKCFDIPDLIDPSVIYSDKSHSMNRSEVIEHVQKRSDKPIPSKRVLQTMLKTPATNWKEFLKDVDEKGMDRDDLIIGLKAKERELKKDGRFFSLMSWKLREYFVVTEYLIKTHFVPLFKGLTMADDMTEVMKKMLDSSSGQGMPDYSSVCIANHIDYEKWNNHQRADSNKHVFRVMGQFLGYPRLIERTHEFFEKSLIYYNNRPDLMGVAGDSLYNAREELVCWEGQSGGLEGLRQKGWSILNLLVIQREARIRNTTVKVLAQGDNQVICTQYRTKKARSEEELKSALKQIVNNNQQIMDAIVRGTEKLGLVINNDETMQSADFLTYGKIPFFRGTLMCLETKRWSRVTCVTNDQVPTCGNLLGTVLTNALTVAHFSHTPTNAIIQYNYFGNFVRLLIYMHDPALRGNLLKIPELKPYLNEFEVKITFLYLDPSLGGINGLSLTRFLIRAFPDPVTEGLSFWKLVHGASNNERLKNVCIKAGHPRLAYFKESDISKLLEDPTSLNLITGSNPTNLIRTEVRKNIIETRSSIRNEIIRDAAEYLHRGEAELIWFLWSITPLFPRFLSEFRAGTFIGVAESLISLFHNSRTIRMAFREHYRAEIDKMIIRSEINVLMSLTKFTKEGRTNLSIWSCSSEQADILREGSWKRAVIGTTIPHPIEMHGAGQKWEQGCAFCNTAGLDYISVHSPTGFGNMVGERGMLPAYLGSKTSEATSIFQPWEKESKIPIIKRATRLRDAIAWFVLPNSNLARSILNNLQALTGVDWSQNLGSFQRTGSALHRFSTTRMSHSGFAAQSPAPLTRMIATTDTMYDLGDKNYDFMYQASLLYAQMTTSVLREDSERSSTTHFHIGCQKCLRPIVEPTLEAPFPYEPESMAAIVGKWKNDDTEWFESIAQVIAPPSNWTRLSPYEQSFHVGRALGFLYGDLVGQSSHRCNDASIFPLAIQKRVFGNGFLQGILDGLVRASACQVIHRRTLSKYLKPERTIYGGVIYLVDQLSKCTTFLALIRTGPIRYELDSVPHRIPASYPTSQSDLGYIVRNYFRSEFSKILTCKYSTKFTHLWAFADYLSSEYLGPFCLSTRILNLCYGGYVSKVRREQLRVIASYSGMLRSGESIDDKTLKSIVRDVKVCTHEVRHACQFIDVRTPPPPRREIWEKEWVGRVQYYPVHYTTEVIDFSLKAPLWIQDPTISGLRTAQIATGSHYKIRSLVHEFNIKYKVFLSAGDGSGGITSALLRWNPKSRGIFNSLMDLSQTIMRGSSPDPPSALEVLGPDTSRCINYKGYWEHPSDLTQSSTWIYFTQLKSSNNLRLDLLVFDMEVKNMKDLSTIEFYLRHYMYELLEPSGCVIYKTYATHLATSEDHILNVVGQFFVEVYICQTEISSSHTSEVYIVMRRLRDKANPYNVDWIALQDFWNNLFCFRTPQVEFDRALSLMKQNLQLGVEGRFLPDPKVFFETLIQGAGVPTGIAHAFVSLIADPCMNLGTYAVVCMTLISLYIIPTVRGHPVEPNPPSDQACHRLGTAWVGMTIWISLQKQDLRIHEECLRVIKTAFPIRIYRYMKEEKHYLGWNCYNTKGIIKDVRIGDGLANVGNWIRVLERLRNHYRQLAFDTNLYTRVIRRFFKNISFEEICKTTGLWGFLKLKSSHEDLSMLSPEKFELTDEAWRE